MRHCKICDMENERIIGRSPLRLIDTRACGRIQTVRAEPVDCLRWKRDEFPALNEPSGALKICG